MIFATLCYLRQDGKTLMIHRIKKENDMHEGKWNGLGGKMYSGETPEECAVREIREESGLEATRMLMKGVLTFPSFSNNQDWYAFVFLVKEFKGEIIESSEGKLAWISNEELLDLNLWEGDKIFIPLLDSPGFFSGKFVYRDGKLTDYGVKIYTDLDEC